MLFVAEEVRTIIAALGVLDCLGGSRWHGVGIDKSTPLLMVCYQSSPHFGVV